MECVQEQETQGETETRGTERNMCDSASLKIVIRRRLSRYIVSTHNREKLFGASLSLCGENAAI